MVNRETRDAVREYLSQYDDIEGDEGHDFESLRYRNGSGLICLLGRVVIADLLDDVGKLRRLVNRLGHYATDLECKAEDWNKLIEEARVVLND